MIVALADTANNVGHGIAMVQIPQERGTLGFALQAFTMTDGAIFLVQALRGDSTCSLY